MRLGVLELLVILAGLVFIFGPKQLPRMTEAVKNSINEFKKGRKEVAADGPVHEEEQQG